MVPWWANTSFTSSSPFPFLPSSPFSLILTNRSNRARESIVVLSLRLVLLEYVPKPQSLVTCTGDNGLTVRRQSQVQDTCGVSGERGDLLHGWILPYYDLILRVSMG